MNLSEVIQHNYRGRRWYTVPSHPDLGELPNVTGILSVIAKPALIPWANKQGRIAMAEVLGPVVGNVLTSELLAEAIDKAGKRPKETLETAGDYGSRAHAIIEKMIRGEEVAVPEELEPTIKAFLAWQRQSGLRLEFAEIRVFSATHRYAGTLDCLAHRGDTLVVPDWTTANGIYAEKAAQTAACAKALGEMIRQEIGEAWVVRFGKDKPDFEVKQVNIEAAFRLFLGAKEMFNTLKIDVFRPDQQQVKADIESLWG